jgi:hypothetical protein
MSVRGSFLVQSRADGTVGDQPEEKPTELRTSTNPCRIPPLLHFLVSMEYCLRHATGGGFMYRYVLLVLLSFAAQELIAQSGPGAATSRADQIQAQRIAKSRMPPSYHKKPIRKYFDGIEKVVRRGLVSVGVGGLGPGSGLTVGSIYRWYSPADQLRARLWGSLTTHRFYGVGTAMEIPHMAGRI